jgi:hypothetical protein
MLREERPTGRVSARAVTASVRGRTSSIQNPKSKIQNPKWYLFHIPKSQSQRLEFDEDLGVVLIVGTGIVFECYDAFAIE